MLDYLKRLWGGTLTPVSEPDIPLGRYTDAYKTPDQLKDWDRALELFELGQPMDAYRAMLRYLSDERNHNLLWQDEGSVLRFELWQGSRRVEGIIQASGISVQTKIAYAPDLNVGFLRRLMEQNYVLEFSRYALSPENHLCMLFDSSLTDASPVKIYQALREVAIHSDKQDDLLLEEFRMLAPAEPLPPESAVSDAEKEVKYTFLQGEIKAALAELDKEKPDPNKYPGGYAYLLLGLAFRLDYLIRPEGFTMDTLENIYSIYFSKDDRSTPQVKLQAIRREYQKLLDRPVEAFYKELYRTRSTFGITSPVPQDRVRALLQGELPNMEWHLQQRHEKLAAAIPDYLVGYILFRFAPPQPMRDLLALYFRVTQAPYLEKLGFQHTYMTPDGKQPDRKAFESALRQLVARYKEDYPSLHLKMEQLEYSSKATFGKTFLTMVQQADFTKKT